MSTMAETTQGRGQWGRGAWERGEARGYGVVGEGMGKGDG